MKASSTCSDGSLCRHMFGSFVRAKKPGSHVEHLHGVQILLLFILLAAQASGNEISDEAFITTSNAERPAHYFVVVTVDTKEQKDESEIRAWLNQVFQNNLQNCVSSPDDELFTNSTTTTAATTTLQSLNTTTAMATTTLQNTTTTAGTTPLQSNNTTTLQSNNTTTVAATTLQSNNTTTAAATTMQSNNTTMLQNNTTTVAATTLQSNNTTTAAATTMQSNNTTATAATTLQSNNTTTAATTTLQSNNTTTAAATTMQSNNTTTTEATTLQSNNTTTAAATTMQSNNTTTPATTTLQSTTTTTPATTPLQSTTRTTPAPTTLQSTTTTTPATTLQSTTTTTPATTLQSTTTTTLATTLQSTTTTTPATTLQSTTTTTPATTLQSTTTTTPATTPLQSTTTTTPARTALTITTTTTPARTALTITTTTTPVRTALTITTTTTPARTALTITTTTTPARTALTIPTTTTPARTALTIPTTTTPARTALTIPTLTTPARTALTIPTTTTPARTALTIPTLTTPARTALTIPTLTTPARTALTIPTLTTPARRTTITRNVPNNLGRRIAREILNHETQTRTSNTTGLFQGIEVACAKKTAISQTNCSVTLKLKQRVSSCCILRTLCVASQTSSDIRVVGKTADITSPLQNDCNSTTQELNSCMYNGSWCDVILGFSNEVPICNLSAALVDIFQSEREVSFNGQVTRAAICGNSIVSDRPLTSSFTSITVDINPASFCAAVTESHNLTCPKGNNVVVQLDEQCNVSPQANSTSSAESQANALLELTRDVSKLNSSQVAQLVSQLENLLSGPNVSLALGNTSVHIVSNLLGASPEVLSDSSTRIIGIVDTVGLKLVLGGEAETLLSPSVALSVKPADGSNFQEIFFSISDPNNVQVRGDSRHGRSLRDSSIPQGSIKLPPSLTQDLTDEQQQLATRVQFNFYQESTVYQDRALGNRKLNSGILGASVSNLSITELQDDVVIKLRNSEPIPANFVATCVYWDFTFNNESGGWNSKGCFVRNSTDNETVCACNHLTSFAILLDLSRDTVISREQATILTFITYIGCGISAIFLSITLLTYLAFGKLRKDIPSKILIQLCIALLLLNLVFLVDAWLALYQDALGLCISTAWFLHYFLLVTFTWMGLEAVHMYQALVKVFNSHISRYMLKLSLVGWGVPMIVVIIVIAIDKDNYGIVSYGKFSDGTSDDFCWLTNDIAFYVAVVAYFCIIFVFNVAMFIVVLVQLCRIKRQNPHNMQHRTTLQDVRSVAGIMILLGLTWGFAFFAWGPLNLPFMYLFAIFNSLQGFFIFVFYCAVKENVRKQWRTYLCCGRMRLAENSEWSRTATQKTVKRSSVSRLASLHSSKSSKSNNSSSSFLVSDSPEQINGIGNPLEDRAITADEDASVDVVLNEINSQYRNQQAP
ncbi:adhesion G-protein coupled receptor G2 [Clinocottus analis]|uniref:adhesion G-protein coupled receptor G2 n=1 Tax=Clinocottus analis TaxID=304258 RepID=UPI0035BEB88B